MALSQCKLHASRSSRERHLTIAVLSFPFPSSPPDAAHMEWEASVAADLGKSGSQRCFCLPGQVEDATAFHLGILEPHPGPQSSSRRKEMDAHPEEELGPHEFYIRLRFKDSALDRANLKPTCDFRLQEELFLTIESNFSVPKARKGSSLT